MDHQFCVLYCRPHMTEEKRVLICGFWKKEDRGAEEILVSLDYTPVKTDIDVQEIIHPVGVCEKRYFVWIKLPENYRNYKKLKVFERDNVELREVYAVETKKVERLREKPPMSVDEVLVDDRGLCVSGWCIAEEDYDISVRDSKGNQIAGKLTGRRRTDVEQAYPECEREWIHGYMFTSKEQASGRIKVIVSCDGKTESVNCLTAQTLPAKVYKKAKESAWKAKVYYQQFGWKQTMRRVVEKIRDKDVRTYEQFRQKYFPDKKELNRQKKEHFAYEPLFSVVVPLYKTPLLYLEALVRSMQAQTYGKWRMYLSDGSGEDSPLTEALRTYSRKDTRIRIIENNCQLHIS